MATFTYESIKNRFKNPTVDGNLDLLDDGAIIKIGADDDLQITHSGSAATITQGTGNTTLDLAGDLIIDVDGGDIALKDAGTQFGGLSNSSGHLLIKDGTTTFLTGAGANATFAGTLATTGVLTANAGINVDNITIDGTEIDLSSGDLTIDVAGNIALDAGGGDIYLNDDGSRFGEFENNSGNLIIKSGSTTAATFSGANVTFAGTINSGAITSSGAIAGTGASITGLSASNLGSGTVPDARFPATLPAASAANLTSIPAGNLTGTIADARFPATLPAASAANLTSIPAGNLTGTIADARFPATLPAASAANLTNVPAANITGTLPAIDGSNLTGISTGITSATAVGTINILIHKSGASIGSSYSGSDLFIPSGVQVEIANNNEAASALQGYSASSTTRSGTWLCLGSAFASVGTTGGDESYSYAYYFPGLFVRTA